MKLFATLFAASIVFGSQSFSAETNKDFKVSTLSFKKPSAWEWVETTSQMRKAQLRINDASAKSPGEVVFFHFGGDGGGTKGNVDRWFSQFQEPREKINARTEEVTVGKTKVTYARAEGTYKSGMPGGPQTPLIDHALAGAIIEDAAGFIFIRLTGPKALVEKSMPEFKQLVESALK